VQKEIFIRTRSDRWQTCFQEGLASTRKKLPTRTLDRVIRALKLQLETTDKIDVNISFASEAFDRSCRLTLGNDLSAHTSQNTLYPALRLIEDTIRLFPPLIQAGHLPRILSYPIEFLGKCIPGSTLGSGRLVLPLLRERVEKGGEEPDYSMDAKCLR